jgi:GNAT superfamily N-acetyltransferase
MVAVMHLTFVPNPELTGELEERIVSVWTDVSNAGGTVGFVPPVTAEDVRPFARAHFDRISAGRTSLLAAVDHRGLLVGTAFFAVNTHRLMRHWCTLRTVMIHPDLQGRGHGTDLLRAAERHARTMGIEALKVTVRSGHGLERFYGSVGYKEVGRVPAAIRVGPGADRDEIVMWLVLT